MGQEFNLRELSYLFKVSLELHDVGQMLSILEC